MRRNSIAASNNINIYRKRIILVVTMIVCCFLTLSIRLVNLAIADPEKSGKRHIAIIGDANLQIGRKRIVDRNGVILATNLKTNSLYADARIVDNPKHVAKLLKDILPDINYDVIVKRLSSKRGFVWIKRHIHPSDIIEINNLGIPALAFEDDEKRSYPQRELFSHILGFVGGEGFGLAGAEKAFDCQLRARDLDIKLANDKCDIAESGVLENNSYTNNKSSDVKLSLDVRVQDVLYKELLHRYTIHNAKGAAGIVMDVTNGEVLAMVSLPAFNPTFPGQIKQGRDYNNATKSLYEMGSTFKAFTMAMAFDNNIIKLKDTFDVTKALRISKYRISDYHGENRIITAPEVFMYSSNIGTVKIIEAVGKEIQKAFLQKLNLFDYLPFELIEVAKPQYPKGNLWGRLSSATISYGHGISVTALHVVSSMAAMVNGGLFHYPTIVKGKKTDEVRVISPETSSIMQKLMRLVVRYGTARKADAKGYMVGGKTGTADKPSVKGYNRKKQVSSFVGAFPMNNPRYVVMAVVDEPEGIKETYGFRTAGWTAAPIVGNVVNQLAPILGIRPISQEVEDGFLKEVMIFKPKKRH